ncbi:TPA: tetratricopeptide repeat protein, partial [Vibrio parahaemolyticus]
IATSKDEGSAESWYLKSAKQGFALAQLNLGTLYANGQGVPKDKVQSEYWFIKAAEQGNSKAQFNLAMIYLNSDHETKNVSHAIKLLLNASENNMPEAQYILGTMYIKGQGVPTDEQQAIRWIQKAAEQGNEQALTLLLKMAKNNDTDALFSLIMMYENGKWGTKQQASGLFNKFRKIVEYDYRGDALAEYRLGYMYEYGNSFIEWNQFKYPRLYRAAAEKGNLQAQYRIARNKISSEASKQFLSGTYLELTDHSQEIMKLLKRSAEQGHIDAQNYLGGYYHLRKNPYQSFKWYRKAAEAGNSYAQIQVGKAYSKGLGVPENSFEAMRWYRKAADQGSIYALNFLANIYAYKEHDYFQAIPLYRIASEKGSANAQFELGNMYANGWGVNQDNFQAYVWYSLASASDSENIETIELRDKYDKKIWRTKTQAQALASRYFEQFGTN